MNDNSGFRKLENSGFLYPKETNGKSPNASGTITIGKELLRWMFEEAKAGREVTLDLAAWDKTSKSGNQYQSVLISKPWVKNGAASRGNFAPRSAPRPVSRREEAEEDVPF
jgi:hypothetical protein